MPLSKMPTLEEIIRRDRDHLIGEVVRLRAALTEIARRSTAPNVRHVASDALEGVDRSVVDRDKALIRIAQIDAMFENATDWGSWMVECSNEREALATRFNLPHKYLARTGSGGRTD